MEYYRCGEHSKFSKQVTDVNPLLKLRWKTDKPVWVDQCPLKGEKLTQAEKLVDEQLKLGHIVLSVSPWNTPIFVIPKNQRSSDYCKILEQ